MLIDECLTWKNHIDCISKTISRNIGVMNKLKHHITYCILHILYCILLLPYLSFGILICGNTCKSYLDKLVKLQKWAIRIISNSHYISHTGPLLAKCNVLTVIDFPFMTYRQLLKTISVNALIFMITQRDTSITEI